MSIDRDLRWSSGARTTSQPARSRARRPTGMMDTADGSREVPVGNIGVGTAQKVAARHLTRPISAVEEPLEDDRDGQPAAARAWIVSSRYELNTQAARAGSYKPNCGNVDQHLISGVSRANRASAAAYREFGLYDPLCTRHRAASRCIRTGADEKSAGRPSPPSAALLGRGHGRAKTFVSPRESDVTFCNVFEEP